MDETRPDMICQIDQFLRASAPIEFAASGDDSERYAHISRVLNDLTTLGAPSVSETYCIGPCNIPVPIRIPASAASWRFAGALALLPVWFVFTLLMLGLMFWRHRGVLREDNRVKSD